jgi:ribosomal protein S6E (S10)
MKTKYKKIKEFDAVKTFRGIKEKISKDIQGMTFEQLKDYLDKSKLKIKGG